MLWFSLYCHVLDQSLAHGMKSKEATKGKRSATVLIEAEYTCLLEAMERLHQWMGKLMYGSGLSLMECIRLHVKDVDCSPHPSHEAVYTPSKTIQNHTSICPSIDVAFPWLPTGKYIQPRSTLLLIAYP